MCPKDNFEIFHVSNRGTNVFQQTTNAIYGVNVPSELRRPNTKVLIEVLDGCISHQGNASLKSYETLGLECNFGNGFSSQVDSGFQSGNYKTLFTCDLQSYNTYTAANEPITFSANNQIPYMISSLPEKIFFNRYAIINGGNEIVSSTKLCSFTLKLTYIDKEID